MSKQLSRTTLIISLVIVLMALASPLMGQQRRPAASAFTQSNEPAAAVFRAARDLITDGEWAKAQDKFSQYVNNYPNEKNLDAALYWLAYAQQKLGRYDQSRQTINKLFAKYQSSSWLDDARLLLAQIPGGTAEAVAMSQIVAPAVEAARADELRAVARAITPAPPAPDLSEIYINGVAPTSIATSPLPAQLVGEHLYGTYSLLGSENDDDPCEFKIVVLQALFQSDVQRGITAATDWLKQGSTQTVRCKSAALSLLARHGGKTVTPVILGVARNEPDVKLRARAISTLGATNDDSVIDPLRDFALNSTDNEIVEASMYALSRHTNDRVISVLSDIATSGKTAAQRKVAIASIASRAGDAAVDALFRIYDADQSIEMRKSVISGFANRRSERAYNKLFEIARGSDNVELRKAAIAGLSRRNNDKALDFLLNLYDIEKNEELKDQILDSFGAGGNYWIATPRAPGLGQGGFPMLAPGQQHTFSSNPVNEKRVIRKLIDIAKNQQEPMQRRKRAIGLLSRSSDPDVQRFLEELLK